MAQVRFVDASAATMPQAELAAMSKTQLLQCISTLQAGWIAVTKQLNTIGRDREAQDSEAREAIASERASSVAASSTIRQLECDNGRLKSLNFDLETEVAKLRRAMKEDPEEPAQARLRDELALANGRVVELERLLRQREPLNVQFLRIQIDEMQRQRDGDRLKLQEKALAITRLEQSLRDAREATDLDRAFAPAEEELPNASITTQSPPSPFHGSLTAASIGAHLAPAMLTSPSVARMETRTGGRRPSAHDLTFTLPGKDVGTQCEAGAARLVELLKEREDALQEAREATEAVTTERDELNDTCVGLQAEIALLRESDARKDELLDELASPQRLKRLSSFRNKGDLEKDEADRVATTDRCRKLEASLASADERAASNEARCRQLEVEVGRLTRSFATVAEENVQLSHSLQAVGNMSAKEIASMLTAGDKVTRLRAELADTQEALERERVAGDDLKRLSRENGALKARVEKSQLEIGALATEASKLERDLKDAEATIGHQQPFVDNYRAVARGMGNASAKTLTHVMSLQSIAESALAAKTGTYTDSIQMVTALRALNMSSTPSVVPL